MYTQTSVYKLKINLITMVWKFLTALNGREDVVSHNSWHTWRSIRLHRWSIFHHWPSPQHRYRIVVLHSNKHSAHYMEGVVPRPYTLSPVSFPGPNIGYADRYCACANLVPRLNRTARLRSKALLLFGCGHLVEGIEQISKSEDNLWRPKQELL